MRQEQVAKGKTLLGIGEYGCWQCTLLPRQTEAGEAIDAENLWVFARSLKEITENVAGVESAVFLGKSTCIADAMTSGVTTPAPDITEAVREATIIKPSLKICPFCGTSSNTENFVKPDHITTTADVVACPSCHMLINRNRLIEMNPQENQK